MLGNKPALGFTFVADKGKTLEHLAKMTEKQNAKSGFTLVELLVVIAIIAILAAVVILIINPLELTRRGRDSARLTDLANLQQAINVAVQEATTSGAAILCVSTGTYPCGGVSFPLGASTRNSNGTGWVRVNLSTQQAVSVPTLPIDPTNNAVLHYAYCANNDTWEINAVLESNQQVTQQQRMANDGGDNDSRYEVGSALNLVNVVAGCTY